MKEVFMFKILFASLASLCTGVQAMAQAAGEQAAQAPASAPAWMQFVPFVIIIGVFYVFLIRPQAKKQRETQNFLGALKVGDSVITQAGLLGRITGLNDLVATLEIADDVQIKVLRSQISMPQSILQKKEVK
jgi:preprotein translocase subunit YajC